MFVYLVYENYSNTGSRAVLSVYKNKQDAVDFVNLMNSGMKSMSSCSYDYDEVYMYDGKDNIR